MPPSALFLNSWCDFLSCHISHRFKANGIIKITRTILTKTFFFSSGKRKIQSQGVARCFYA
jgi:hypothetical protein